MKKILITNDDGIGSGGIKRLAAAAKKYGEVWVVAPESEKSAASHSITLRKPIDVMEYDFPVEGVRSLAVSGTPADCVRLALLGMLKVKPDIVFSGINYGFNTGGDAQYSATVAAAMEAVYLGIPAVAFSEGTDYPGQVSELYLDEIIGEIIDSPYTTGRIVNVNFPDCRPEELRGILRDRKPNPTGVYIDSYIPDKEESGKTVYRLKAEFNPETEEGSDLRALLENYISIGFLRNIS